MLFHKKLVASIVLLVCQVACASQENQQNFVYFDRSRVVKEIAQQDEIPKIERSNRDLEEKSSSSNFLSSDELEYVKKHLKESGKKHQKEFYENQKAKRYASAPIYFFKSEDFGEPVQRYEPATKSLYARYNSLLKPLQDHIDSFLIMTVSSMERDSHVRGFQAMQALKWRKDSQQSLLSACRFLSMSHVQQRVEIYLRTEYWLRFVKRARNEHTMINNRMAPSEFVIAKYSAQYFRKHPPITSILEDICCHEHSAKNLEMAALFIGCGALVNSKKNKYYTALTWAIINRNLSMVRLLMHAGLIEPYGFLNNNSSKTAIHLAAKYDAIKIIRYLHDKDYDLNVQDSNGDTPLDIAFNFKCADTVALLKDLGAKQNLKNNRRKKYKDRCSIT